MFALPVGGDTLRVSEDAIEYGRAAIDPRQATHIRWVRTDRYLNMVLIDQVRRIIIGAGKESIGVDCTAAISAGGREAEFQTAWGAIWSTAGLSIAARLLRELKDHGEVSLCGCKLARSGVWIEGSWRFLKWSGAPRLVSWQELRVSSSEADLVISSHAEPSKTMTISFNETDNVPVLDFLIRHLLDGCRFAAL